MKPNVIVFGNVGTGGKLYQQHLAKGFEDRNIDVDVQFCEDISKHDEIIYGAVYHFSVEHLQQKELQEQVIKDIQFFKEKHPHARLFIVCTGVQKRHEDDCIPDNALNDEIQNFFTENKEHLEHALKYFAGDDPYFPENLFKYLLNESMQVKTLFKSHVEDYVTDLQKAIEDLSTEDFKDLNIGKLTEGLLNSLAYDLLKNPEKTNKIEVLQEFETECRKILKPMYESQAYKDKVAAEKYQELITKLILAILYVIVFPVATLFCALVGGVIGFGLGTAVGAAFGPGALLIGGMIGAVICGVGAGALYGIAQAGTLGLLGFTASFCKTPEKDPLFSFFKRPVTDPLVRFTNEVQDRGFLNT